MVIVVLSCLTYTDLFSFLECSDYNSSLTYFRVLARAFDLLKCLITSSHASQVQIESKYSQSSILDIRRDEKSTYI